MNKGDKLVCLNTINNLFGQHLFEEGKVYEVLFVDNEDVKVRVTLNHNLYSNEYTDWELEWILKNFKDARRAKINKIRNQ